MSQPQFVTVGGSKVPLMTSAKQPAKECCCGGCPNGITVPEIWAVFSGLSFSCGCLDTEIGVGIVVTGSIDSEPVYLAATEMGGYYQYVGSIAMELSVSVYESCGGAYVDTVVIYEATVTYTCGIDPETDETVTTVQILTGGDVEIDGSPVHFEFNAFLGVSNGNPNLVPNGTCTAGEGGTGPGLNSTGGSVTLSW